MTPGNGRLWEPNQSLDGSDSLSSQKDEGTTRKILFPFWHSRMHQRLFLVIFCPFSQKWYFVSKIVLTNCEKNWFMQSRIVFEIQDWRSKICKLFVITRTIYSNSERSVQFSKQNAFLFLEVSQICHIRTNINEIQKNN